jgi:hypothetical protein
MFSHYQRICAERLHSVSERPKESKDTFVTRNVTISSRRVKEKEKVSHLKGEKFS